MPTTGPAVLPENGLLQYNAVTWSSLHSTRLNGKVVQDDARRVTKYVEWTLEAEGVVTLDAGQVSTDANMAELRRRLSVHGAPLLYDGKGTGRLRVNEPGFSVRDVAWGPVPEVMEMQPLGAGRSVMLKWRVVTRVPEVTPGELAGGRRVPNELVTAGVLQFNYETSLVYDDEGYLGVTHRGVLEIPLTYRATGDHAVTDTVNNYRQLWLDFDVDLTLYKVVRRSFNYSRDKRTCNWEYAIQQHSPMGLPYGCPKAGGTMSVRPFKTGPHMAANPRWNVSLRCTYVLSPQFRREMAARLFYVLLWFRMRHVATFGELPPLANPANAGQQRPNIFAQAAGAAAAFFLPGAPIRPVVNLGAAAAAAASRPPAGNLEMMRIILAAARAGFPVGRGGATAILTSFTFDEGLYDDSKSITFEASWMLLTNFNTILAATGVWRWMPVTGGSEDGWWASSLRNVSGWRGWLSGSPEAGADVIVDITGPVR